MAAPLVSDLARCGRSGLTLGLLSISRNPSLEVAPVDSLMAC